MLGTTLKSYRFWHMKGSDDRLRKLWRTYRPEIKKLPLRKRFVVDGGVYGPQIEPVDIPEINIPTPFKIPDTNILSYLPPQKFKVPLKGKVSELNQEDLPLIFEAIAADEIQTPQAQPQNDLYQMAMANNDEELAMLAFHLLK